MTGRAMFLFGQPTVTGGMGSVVDLGGTLVAYNDVPDPALADWLAMSQDWAAMGEDMRSGMVRDLESLDPASAERVVQELRRARRIAICR